MCVVSSVKTFLVKWWPGEQCGLLDPFAKSFSQTLKQWSFVDFVIFTVWVEGGFGGRGTKLLYLISDLLCFFEGCRCDEGLKSFGCQDGF